MTDTETKGIPQKPDVFSKVDFEIAKDNVWGFVSNVENKRLEYTNISELEKDLNTVANGLEDRHKFHDAALTLWRVAEEAPETWEEEDKNTIPNRVGLLALKAMGDHSETIKKKLGSTTSDPYWGYLLTARMLDRKVWLIDSTIKDKAIDILRTEKDIVKRRIFKGMGVGAALTKYYQIYLPDEFDSWLVELRSRVEKHPTEGLAKAFGVLTSKETFFRTRGVIESLVRERGFNLSEAKSADLVEAWIASDKFEDIGVVVGKNLVAMYALESQEPGSVKYLDEVFGINCFGRYPTEMLLEQYRTRDHKDSPYGLLLFPRGDHNGGFYEDKKVLSHFFTQLQGIKRTDGKKYDIRAFECGNLYSIGKAIIRSFKNYGRIHFVLIGGHGSKEQIWFDNDETLSRTDILNGKGIQRIGEYFIPQPPVVLVACSAGKEKGVAEEISKIGGGEVFGAKENTSLNSLSVRLENGVLKFDVQYAKGETGKYQSVSRVK